ncbi:hypothetical protein AB5J55_43565 [Streptomyces sp. R11]|uniref:Uncharacterized protein n=1 Tax=Streptomyces sp. R11 TaxID=3238625 RepID=A0AB39NDA0_9ACTN
MTIGPPDRVREQHAAVHAVLDEGGCGRSLADWSCPRSTVRRLANAATADELLVGR